MSGLGSSVVLVMKLDSNGQKVWAKTYNSSRNSITKFYSANKTSDGNGLDMDNADMNVARKVNVTDLILLLIDFTS